MSDLEEYAKSSLKDREIIAEAERRGYIIHKPQPPVGIVEFDTARLRGKKRVRLGVLSDTHAGSKFQQPFLLNQHAKWMKKRGVDGILMPGDITDGTPGMHPGFVYETWAHGADAQAEAALDMIPDLGIPKWVIGGNHDHSHYKAGGVDVVAAICSKRDDMTYLSPGEGARNAVGYVRFDEALVELCHPYMGSTRTRSYRLETWIENQDPPRPNITVMGNFHKLVEGVFRSVWGIMVPAFQSKSQWMASKGLQSTVGSCIIEFGTQIKGLAPNISVEWNMEWQPRRNDYPGGKP